MYVPYVIAIRFLEANSEVLGMAAPANDGEAPEQVPMRPEPWSESWEEEVDYKLRHLEELFLEELGELLGRRAREGVVKEGRGRSMSSWTHVHEVKQGVARLELTVKSGSSFQRLVPGVILDEAIQDGKLDLFGLHRGRGVMEWTGDAATLYTFEKARRFRLFLNEWRGKVPTTHFRDVLNAVVKVCEAKTSESIPRGLKKVAKHKERAALLESFDQTFSAPRYEEIRKTILAIGIPWRDWCRAGRGLKARLGLDPVYF